METGCVSAAGRFSRHVHYPLLLLLFGCNRTQTQAGRKDEENRVLLHLAIDRAATRNGKSAGPGMHACRL